MENVLSSVLSEHWSFWHEMLSQVVSWMSVQACTSYRQSHSFWAAWICLISTLFHTCLLPWVLRWEVWLHLWITSPQGCGHSEVLNYKTNQHEILKPAEVQKKKRQPKLFEIKRKIKQVCGSSLLSTRCVSLAGNSRGGFITLIKALLQYSAPLL